MQPPSLTLSALSHQLARMFAGGREHRPLIAIHGVCDDPRPIDLPGVGRFEVVLADSELGLRRQLHEPGQAAPRRTVYLVPWTARIPLDVAGYFAHDGRVFRIDTEVRVSHLFTAPFETIDPEVLSSKLVAWLLRVPPPASLPSPGGRLTFKGLWDTWLQHEWGLDLDTSGLSTLLAWAAGNGFGPRLAAALGHEAAAGVQSELEAILDRRLGEPATAIFRAWLADRGAMLLGFAILCETLAPKSDHDQSLRTWLALKAETFLGAKGEAQQRRKLLHRLGGLASPTLGELRRSPQRSVLRAALDAAEALADDHVRHALIDSPRLLSSWQQRLAALGRLLSRAAAAPTHQQLDQAIAVLRSLENHDRPRYSPDGRAAGELARAEAGVRLLAWLVACSDSSHVPKASSADALARWYVDEGAYLDSARQTARGPAGDPFGTGVAAVVARIDDERRELDHRFARALVDKTVGDAVIPIAHALDALAVRFLHDRPARRLLVVLLPAMAWTQTLELLASLDEDASRWGPLAWHGLPEARSGVPCPAVLAAIPSVAAISRSALLAGKPVPAGLFPDPGGDRKRLAEHRGLARLSPGGPPPLFHRRALDDSAGTEVLAQLRDPHARFVGVILDATDSARDLEAPQTSVWRARSIRPLFELLDAAQASGRAVLLASDHGHVPAGRLQPTGERNPRASARWRPWQAGAAIHGYETAFSGDDAWSPRGAQGVIVVHDEEHRHTPASASPGESGGATLAEVVTPMCLLGWEGMDSDHDDPTLSIRPAVPPPWWHLHLEPQPPREIRRSRPAPKDTGPQLPLLPETPVAPASTGDSGHPILRQLLASPIFAARAIEPRQHDLARRAVEALLALGQSAEDNALASTLGLPARRVAGFIVTASEVLNVDGYAVLQYDSHNRRAELHLQRLIHCFELECA
ncbi:BREX-2 system phosphatase PglZ [Nannocystis sp. SCPEA4]|uniref:BREX-2 system phosphatase PglZ n=1 Tax=Nannocystis sp. SCPEA4 TaxID=2996787 RepID=UPI00227223F4|nr:BREX-2 system phosphatase PglZ [Nannocystis sp. SCPEA4]MCY1059698.1 BREX-2 system phosphatase PglZ [Nannocystis sp. SCPEA4]